MDGSSVTKEINGVLKSSPEDFSESFPMINMSSQHLMVQVTSDNAALPKILLRRFTVPLKQGYPGGYPQRSPTFRCAVRVQAQHSVEPSAAIAEVAAGDPVVPEQSRKIHPC